LGTEHDSHIIHGECCGAVPEPWRKYGSVRFLALPAAIFSNCHNGYQVEDSLAMTEASVPFGRYRLLSLLGKGGMAEVYRAILPGPMGFAKEVAVKRIDPRLTEDEQFVQALVNEARIGGELRHPHLVEVYEFDRIGEQYYMSMQYVDGWTLQDVLRLCRARKTPMPLSVAVATAIPICEGLHYAHTAHSRSGQPLNLVHRDLKPANVMLSRNGDILVMDFGIAKADTNMFHNTTAGMSKGTPLYMSPEQVKGDPLDRRSDLFALGSLLYEMVSPKPCFYGKDLLSILHRIATTKPAEVAARLPDEARLLEPIVTLCLAQDPEARYQSAREIRLALTQLQREIPDGPSLSDWLDELAEGLPAQRETGDFGSAHTPAPMASQPHQADAIETLVGDLQPQSGGAAGGTAAEAVAVLPETNLRPPPDSFVGREDELEELAAQLVTGSARLVTVLGPGGTGKTRLATHFGLRHQRDFPGGVWRCDLTESRTMEGLISAVGQGLGLALAGKDPLEQLTHAIRGRGQVLLLLDTFEQLVDLAGGSVGGWLQAAPEARFLVTSRRRLSIQGEMTLALAPLSTDDAVQLFEDRAKMVQVSFEVSDANRSVVRRIVQQLDCLSLAIELAAARIRMLPPERLLERLSERFKLLRGGRRDMSGRQATLKSAIRWSWDLLQPWEKLALAQCSVFRGGFTLESAEEVLDLDAWAEAPWIMDNVEALVDHSLVRVDEPRPGVMRFSLYESVREFAAEMMAEKGAVPAADADSQTGAAASWGLRQRHALHYAHLGTQEHLDSLDRHGGVQRRAELELELENLVAGAAGAIATGEPDAAANCALGATNILNVTGPCDEGVAVTGRVLGLAGLDSGQRARVLRMRGELLRTLGRIEEATADFTAALELARAAGDLRAQGSALYGLGLAQSASAHLDDALASFEESLARLQEVGDRGLQGIAYGSLGLNHAARGNMTLALEHYAAALAIHRQEGNHRCVGIVLGNEALIHKEQGRLQSALDTLEEALAIHREVGNRRFEGIVLGNMGWVCRELGLWERAMECCTEALTLHRQVGDRRFEGIVLGHLGDLWWERGRLGKSQERLAQAIEILDQCFTGAAGFFRGSLAIIEAHRGNFDAARQLLARGDEQLRGVLMAQLGVLLCKRTEVEHLAGDGDTARAALDEAEALSIELEAGADSELGRYLEKLRPLLAEAPAGASQ
jgi:predicted ATPase/serine/threonine protein kinase/tetratricopeptide (TPR) repeat protein